MNHPSSLFLAMAGVLSISAATSQAGVMVGFDFNGRTPEFFEGDLGAPLHVFVHHYPMPSKGFVTEVTYLNDVDRGGVEVAEFIDLLILRPVTGGWDIIHRITLPDDDTPPITTGTTTLALPIPLAVEAGDLFAHWQSGTRSTGPIPFNGDSTSIDGLTRGKFGFSSGDVAAGQFIANTGFSGSRDYFINVNFESATVPEPSGLTVWCLLGSAAGIANFRRWTRSSSNRSPRRTGGILY